MRENVIEVKNLCKKFKVYYGRTTKVKGALISLLQGKNPWPKPQEFWALYGINFSIQKGEFVGIMGRNGAGKSTLMKLLCGIYSPTVGSVSMKGRVIPLIELGAGFHPDLSGYENIFLNASILGFGKKITEEAVPKILEFSELGDHIHLPVKNYSSGMLVRLGFSIASHLEGDILLMDEVLAVGDIGFQKKSLAKIKELYEKGKTVILITHSPEAVLEHCNRCIVIDSHHKVFDGNNIQDGVNRYLENVLETRS